MPIRGRATGVYTSVLAFALAASAGAQLRVESGQVHTYSDRFRTTARVSYPVNGANLPLLVLIPGLGSSHVTYGAESDSFAEEGYFVVTYDVRGQASTKALNPGRGSRLWSLREWEDLAEILDWVSFRWGERIDESRIGIFGDSQGGVHAWAAAAFSEKPLPGSLRLQPFPRISAVVPRIMAPQTTDVLVPGGNSFHERFGAWVADDSERIVRFEPSFRTKAVDFLDRGDAAGLAAWLRSIPGREFSALLRQTKVPIFCQLSWLDEFLHPDLAVRALETLPLQTPRRLLVSTGFHGTPLNTYQYIMRQRATLAWFDHYVKNQQTTPDGGPPVITAALPGDPAQYQLLQSVWRLRDDASLPAADTKRMRWDLDVFGRLRTPTQDVFAGRRTIAQKVMSTYTWRDFARERDRPLDVAKALPLDRFEFESPPLTEDLEISGAGEVVLRVTSSASPFQVGVRLFAKLPSGARQLIASGGQTFTGTETADRRISLGSSGAVVAAPSKLVLEVSNQVMQLPGAADRFRLQPLFKPFTLGLDIPAGRVARLELSVRDEPRVDLGTGIFDIDIANPKEARMFVQTSQKRANTLYFLLLSLSRPQEAPVPGGRTFWFRRDSFTDFVFQFATTPAFQSFVGLTDAGGVARPILKLGELQSIPPVLRGSELFACPILVPGDVIEAGATLRIRFR